jgi:ubiquinone/menaquinone biosynthesis C-methylase UbiE
MGDPYRLIARFYDAIVEPFNASLRRYVLKFARPEPGASILEIGCGTGTNLQLFAEVGCRVAGIDLSPSMLDLARTKLGATADLHLGDAADMPFGDADFDLVVAFLTLHEMPQASRIAVVGELARVVSPDGDVLFIDYRPGPYRFPKGWAYRSIIYCIEFLAGWEHFQNHRDFLARGGLPPLLEAHGLSVAKQKVLAGGNIHVLLATSAPA